MCGRDGAGCGTVRGRHGARAQSGDCRGAVDAPPSGDGRGMGYGGYARAGIAPDALPSARAGAVSDALLGARMRAITAPSVLSSAQGFLGRAADVLLETLSPTRCIGCERPGTLLCPDCAARLVRIDPETACPRCGAPFGRLVCTECHDASDLDWCVAATVYAPPAPAIVRGYKDAGERRLAGLIAGYMAGAFRDAVPYAPDGLLDAPSSAALAFVPATRAAYRRRGFDHMEEVARLLAPQLGLPLLDVLAKRGSADQRRLGRVARAERSRGVYEVVAPVAGMDVVLADDVSTTGATLAAAAQALRDAGARRVVGLVFARVW